MPLRNVQILPFNLDHAIRTGEFAAVIFEENKLKKLQFSPRTIIPNDAKLFAQADVNRSITHFVTSDSRSKNTYGALKRRNDPKFGLIDISIPYDQTFGTLDLY